MLFLSGGCSIHRYCNDQESSPETEASFGQAFPYIKCLKMNVGSVTINQIINRWSSERAHGGD